MILRYIIAAVLGYLLGSISFAVLITKGLMKKDVRTMGSGNAGATNVARVFGMGVGAATFVGDVLKTYVSMEIGKWLGGEAGMAIAAAACMVGHCWPVFYNFKGGKGVSVGGAIALVIDLRIIAILVAIFFCMAFITKIVSLSSITVAVCLPILLVIFGYNSVPMILLGIFAGAMVIIMHTPNIKRLIAGKEPKFKAKSASNTSKEEYGGKR